MKKETSENKKERTNENTIIIVQSYKLFWQCTVFPGLLVSAASFHGFRLKKVARDEIPLIVLLLRHGESTANVDPAVYESTPDHAIPLSERGQRMTDIAGAKRIFLSNRLF